MRNPPTEIIHPRIHAITRSSSTEPCQKPNEDQKDHQNIAEIILVNLKLIPIESNTNFWKYQYKINKIKNSSFYGSNRAKKNDP